VANTCGTLERPVGSSASSGERLIFWTALTFWFLAALLAWRAFTRFGWHDVSISHLPPGWVDQPYIVTKWLGSAQQAATIAYFLVTIFLVVATWLRFGWAGAVIAFVVSSLTFGRLRAAGMSGGS